MRSQKNNTELTRAQLLLAIMDNRLAEELLAGAQIIFSYFPYLKKGKGNKGFILVKRKEPVKEEREDRMFYYAMYQRSIFTDGKLYEATEFVKMSERQAIKLSVQKFRD
jgi:hypothetical protein